MRAISLLRAVPGAIWPAAGSALALSLALAACAAAPPPAPGVQYQAEAEGHRVSYIRIATRPGVVQGFQFIQVEKPLATIVLFVGGGGNLPAGLRRGPAWFPGEAAGGGGGRGGRGKRGGAANFLIRIRGDLADADFNLALVDVPSDRRDMEQFRTTAAHAQDVRAVIAYVRNVAPVPLWLVGTSKGTLSAASAAARLPGAVDGLVLSSTIFEAFGSEPTVYSVDLDAITVPTLLVHHRNDGCRVTPPRGMPILADHLPHAPKVERVWIQGGGPPITGECEPGAAHGYYGVEEEAASAIVAFIKANLGPPAARATP